MYARTYIFFDRMTTDIKTTIVLYSTEIYSTVSEVKVSQFLHNTNKKCSETFINFFGRSHTTVRYRYSTIHYCIRLYYHDSSNVCHQKIASHRNRDSTRCM